MDIILAGRWNYVAKTADMVISFSVVIIMHIFFFLPLLPYVYPYMAIYVTKNTLIESDDINR